MAIASGAWRPFEAVSDTRSLRERRKTAAGIARAGAALRQLFASFIDDYWDDGLPVSLSLHAVNQADAHVNGALHDAATIGELLTASPRGIKKMTKRARRELNRFLAKLGLGGLGSSCPRVPNKRAPLPRVGARS